VFFVHPVKRRAAMKMVRSWRDLEPYGIVALTGESCGLGYRILFDLTERGQKILAKCLGLPTLLLAEPWNRGTRQEPHVGSIMLAQVMLVPIGVFALLESGCTECWQHERGELLGIEPGDTPEQIEFYRSMYAEVLVRKFAYRGTAGDRNLHVMTGRVL
jgi:hypothetical protein